MKKLHKRLTGVILTSALLAASIAGNPAAYAIGRDTGSNPEGNRQVHWNPVWEELKAKVKTALEDDEKSAIYARRKVEVESVFGHIKGNRSFRRFSLRGLEKVHVEFGIVALAHNLLKVAGIRLATFLQKQCHKKSGSGNFTFSLQLFYFRDLLDSPFLIWF